MARAARKTPSSRARRAEKAVSAGIECDNRGRSVGQAKPEPASGSDIKQLIARVQSSLLDSADPHCVVDPKGRALYANSAYRDARGPLADAQDDPGLPALFEAAEKLDGRLKRELMVELDGRTRFFAAEYQLLQDAAGNSPAMLCVFSPIDEMKRTQAALGLSDDRFNDIARLVSDLIWEVDRNLAITYISPRVIEVLGYHPRELLGVALSDLMAPDSDPPVALSGQGPHAPFGKGEIELLDKSGASVMFRLSGLPVYSRDSGELLGFRGTAQDVTSLMAHEAALFEAVDAAEAANRAKSEFLANMSHELRTPLNAIIGFSDVINEEHFGAIGNPRYKSYVGDILLSARHLLTLINDILDVAKIEAGKLELEEAAAEPAELCRQTLRLVEDRAARAGIALACELPGDLPRLRIDPRKVKQILLNLLSNAIKFTPRGGRVELAAGRRADGGFGFSVRDSGIGIAPEDQPTALAPFGQVDSQLARKFDGTGLGLPLSRALANLHGGDLELDSAPGQGTIVTVTLPKKRVIEA